MSPLIWIAAGLASTPLTADDVLLASDAASDDWFGFRLAPGGDIDGDGVPDLLVGAPDDDSITSDGGTIYVCFGAVTGLDPAACDEVGPSDPHTSDHFGMWLDGVGDVDGDGYDDVLVGSPEDDDGGSASGAAYVLYGSASGIDSSREDKLMPAEVMAGDEFGEALGAAGDLDGDGYADFAVGAPNHDGVESGSGAFWVFYGSASGPDSSRTQYVTPSGGDIGDSLGAAFASGDLDADGYSDLVVGAWGVTNGEGAVYAFHGSASGLDTTTGVMVQASDADKRTYFGLRAASAGDVDADGYDDVFVAAPGDDDNETNSGSVYVLFGGASGLSSEQEYHASDGAKSDELGYGLARGADVNGDGYSDLIAGSWSHDGCGNACGAAYVVYGSASGLDTSTEEILQPADGAATYDFGMAATGIGDLDADGADELAVGAPARDSWTGAVYPWWGTCPDADADGTCAVHDCDDADAAVDCIPDLAGPSPGVAGQWNAAVVTDVTPGAQVWFLAGPSGSSTASCGAELDLASVTRRTLRVADSTGQATFVDWIPSAASGTTRTWQVLVPSDCVVSASTSVTWL